MKTAVLGLGLTVVVTLFLASVWGRDALAGGLGFGGLATAIQVAAVAMLKRAWKGDFPRVLLKHGLGMGLRLLGIVVWAAAVSFWPEVFLPLPSALGFLGVLFPLLLLDVWKLVVESKRA